MKKLPENHRVKLKWHLPALDWAMCLQKKTRYGWRTVSWTYPSIFIKYYEKCYVELVNHLVLSAYGPREGSLEKALGNIILNSKEQPNEL